MAFTRRGRFVDNHISKLQQDNWNPPISGYKDRDVKSLEEAVESIVPFVGNAMEYAAEAKQKCTKNTQLTINESAAIYLYTMDTPFYEKLNEALRYENPPALKPWFDFLKLFFTALAKLPSRSSTVWRGIANIIGSNFGKDHIFTWWNVTSCSSSARLAGIFANQQGTLFCINTIYGKDIAEYSWNKGEEEIVLMPGTRLCVKDTTFDVNGFSVVHLKECRIERFMNPAKSFPIEQSYINLAIVQTKDQQEKEKKLRDSQHNDAIIEAFENIHGTKTPIDVKEIFKTCKDKRRNVLVFGRAGIGKSTFCRYIAYQWATGIIWQEYELIALIPLRSLTADRYPILPASASYSLIDVLKKECFSFDPYLSEKDETQLQEQFYNSRILWLLDGYDEIGQNVPTHIRRLLNDQLLKTPHHIITSRPYMNTLSHSVQLEITGFTDDNISKYVKQFFDQVENEAQNLSAEDENVLSFLKRNLRIHVSGVIRIGQQQKQ
ncbi:unnamed protein product [Adineta steineri]|uniref:NAD(P)(+)--arginine ADP-ribosyltransferase n=1 Tax=Adineta steineri TaxID=433720 RepID=A0A818XD16_9BILA|nr:unnamed protein product [Adineta steineri]CAF3737091.1 unnamed protein product [Adineta steineri]